MYLLTHSLTYSLLIPSIKPTRIFTDKLYDLGITHILNTAKQLPHYHENSKKYKFVYMKIPLMDDESENITTVMDQAKAFIQRVEEIKGRVLVHCIAGASRSVTIVMMYFMMVHRVPLRQIYSYIKAIRPQVNTTTPCNIRYVIYTLPLTKAQGLGNNRPQVTTTPCTQSVTYLPPHTTNPLSATLCNDPPSHGLIYSIYTIYPLPMITRSLVTPLHTVS